MKTELFYKTKTKLTSEFISILTQLKNLEKFNNSIDLNQISKAYIFNQKLVVQLQKIYQDIYNNKINNPRSYKESDLYFSQTIYKLHKQNGFELNKTNTNQNFTIKIKEQIKYMLYLIEDLPEDFGINVISKIDGISNMPLDIYQIMHLSSLFTASELTNFQKQFFIPYIPNDLHLN